MIFTIDNDTNNITAHATKQEAKAVPNSEHFGSAEQLADLAENWSTSRLIEIWNGIPGMTPVKRFTDRKAAVVRIWKAIQSLGESLANETLIQHKELAHKTAQPKGTPQPPSESPHTEAASKVVPGKNKNKAMNEQAHSKGAANNENATVGEHVPGVAPKAGEATKRATRQENAPAGNVSPNTPRENSKTSQVIAMLKRDGGATVEEIMTTMGWQKHTTRALLSAGGSLTKKHGLAVTSKKVGDQRVYSIKL